MVSNDRRVRRVGGCVVVVVPAEVDVTNADVVRGELLSAVGLGAPVVVVDMSGTGFCDSAGVEAVIVAYRRAVADGIELRLAAVAAVRRVFALVGADRLIAVFPSLEAALAAAPSARAGVGESG